LAIAEQLAGIDKSNVQWQTDLVVSLYKIATFADGDRKSAALDKALAIVERLEVEGRLSPDKRDWKSRLLALRETP
jgi:hypothetical protein